MSKYKLIIEYDGTNFVGWQIQDNGKSIQKSIEDAIKTIIYLVKPVDETSMN